jgi:hypothetical protein
MTTIRNKVTGEIRVVDEAEAQKLLAPKPATSSYPDASAFDKAIMQDLSQGGKNIEKIKSVKDILYPAGSTTDVKNEMAYRSSLGLLQALEENYTNAKGGEYTGLGALVAGTKKNIAGQLNLDKAAGIYNREKKGFTANLKTITGDVGVMTQKDYERIESLLPKFTDDPEMAAKFFQDMRDIIANKFQGTPTKSEYVRPEVKGGLLQSVLPGISDLYKQEVETQKTDNPLQTAMRAGFPLLQILDPLGISGREKTNAIGYNPTGGRAAGEVLSILGGADIAKSGINKAKTLLSPKPATLSEDALNQGLKQIGQGKTIRNAAIEEAETFGKKVDGNKVFKTVSKELNGIKSGLSDSEAAQVDELIKRAGKFYKGKMINPTTAKSRWDLATKGFTDAGKVGDTVKAAYHRALRDGLRGELETVATGFEKGTSMIHTGLQQEKLLKTVRTGLQRQAIKKGLQPTPSVLAENLKKVGKVALGTGATVALLKILGLGGSSNR